MGFLLWTTSGQAVVNSDGKQLPGELGGEEIVKGLHVWGSAEGIKVQHVPGGKGHFCVSSLETSQQKGQHLAGAPSTHAGSQHSGRLRASFQTWK